MSRVLCSGTAAAVVAASLLVQAQAPGPDLSSRPGRPETRTLRSDQRVGTIEGTAVSSFDQPLPNWSVRLRDAARGRTVDTQRSDRAGSFVFRDVEPGRYVVELVGRDQQTVLAASALISVEEGDALTTIVKLPYRLTPMAGFLGQNAASAVVVMSAAAAAGVMATAVTGASASPQQ